MKEIIPPELYHYTDQAGFIGIIENKELWATQIQYLNDSKEFNLAIDIAMDIIGKKLSDRLRRSVKDVVEDIKKRVLKMDTLNICVCSFSEQSDLLSQWRGYSKGMAGYSIGFDSVKLENIATANSFLLRKCIYDTDVHRAEIGAVLDRLIDKHKMTADRIRTLPVSNRNYIVPTPFVKDVKEELSLIFPLIKHHSFKEESEWRLITNGAIRFNKLSFRPGKSNIVPYTKLKLDELNKTLIKKVIVGHTPNKELAKLSTKDFLRKERLNITVDESAIPFRNW
ncbi:DUF2971 domain-containing protein [Ewingella americana]